VKIDMEKIAKTKIQRFPIARIPEKESDSFTKAEIEKVPDLVYNVLVVSGFFTEVYIKGIGLWSPLKITAVLIQFLHISWA